MAKKEERARIRWIRERNYPEITMTCAFPSSNSVCQILVSVKVRRDHEAIKILQFMMSRLPKNDFILVVFFFNLYF